MISPDAESFAILAVSSSSSARRPEITTVHPARARAIEQARPIPELAPVTTAIPGVIIGAGVKVAIVRAVGEDEVGGQEARRDPTFSPASARGEFPAAASSLSSLDSVLRLLGTCSTSTLIISSSRQPTSAQQHSARCPPADPVANGTSSALTTDLPLV